MTMAGAPVIEGCSGSAVPVARIVRRATRDAAYRVFLFGSWVCGPACERLPTPCTVHLIDLAAVRDAFRAVALSEVVGLEAAA